MLDANLAWLSLDCFVELNGSKWREVERNSGLVALIFLKVAV